MLFLLDPLHLCTHPTLCSFSFFQYKAKKRKKERGGKTPTKIKNNLKMSKTKYPNKAKRN